MHAQAPGSSKQATARSYRRSGARRAILLDALGTILELEPPAPALRAQLDQRFGIQITIAEAQSAMAAEIAYYRAHLDEGHDPAGIASLRARCAEVLRAALPRRRPIAQLGGAALTEALLASLRFRTYDDVRPALDGAREQGLATVVVSNWDISLHTLLEQLGLTALLDGVVTSAQVGERKPSPAMFDAALRLVGIDCGQAIHVGDNLDEDVEGARGAGIEAILIRRDGKGGPRGVETITSLRRLLHPNLASR